MERMPGSPVRLLLPALLLLGLPACAAFGYPVGPAGPVSGGSAAGVESYEIDGRRYDVRPSARGYRETGVASWYGPGFDGRPTSSGEPFDRHGFTAAHRTLPLGAWVEVTNLRNGRTVTVRINDRGPFRNPERRIIDLSYAAASELGMIDAGTVEVEVRALDPREGR